MHKDAVDVREYATLVRLLVEAMAVEARVAAIENAARRREEGKATRAAQTAAKKAAADPLQCQSVEVKLGGKIGRQKSRSPNGHKITHQCSVLKF